jgi:hypothetical protein
MLSIPEFSQDYQKSEGGNPGGERDFLAQCET